MDTQGRLDASRSPVLKRPSVRLLIRLLVEPPPSRFPT